MRDLRTLDLPGDLRDDLPAGLRVAAAVLDLALGLDFGLDFDFDREPDFGLGFLMFAMVGRQMLAGLLQKQTAMRTAPGVSGILIRCGFFCRGFVCGRFFRNIFCPGGPVVLSPPPFPIF